MATPLVDKMPSSKKAVRIVQDQNVEILSRLEAIETGSTEILRASSKQTRGSTITSTFARNGLGRQTRAKTID